MTTPADGNRDTGVTGLIVATSDGQYFAIGWDALELCRVPAEWVAAVAALVRGDEPAGGADVRGFGGSAALSGMQALLLASAGDARAVRPAVQRLEAWVVLR